MNFFLLSITVFIIWSCQNAKREPSKNPAPIVDTICHLPVTISDASDFNWESTLVLKYINANKNYFNSLKDKDTISTEWFLDSRENTDTAHYLIFEIGHSSENNFIADRCLYIDSLTKNIYEYDLPNEQLVKWNH